MTGPAFVPAASRGSSDDERVVCLKLRAPPRIAVGAETPREVLLLEDCAIAVYEDDRAVRFPSLDVVLRVHRLDVADLELERG